MSRKIIRTQLVLELVLAWGRYSAEKNASVKQWIKVDHDINWSHSSRAAAQSAKSAGGTISGIKFSAFVKD